MNKAKYTPAAIH